MATPPAAAGPSGAERLLRAAVAAGVEVCFANPGTSEMHFVGAIDAVGGLRPVLGLHETVCSGAADGYARMAGKPALTLLHLGPGLANALANLHNARRAGTPVVNLVGDMASWHRPADPLLHTDIPALAATVSAHTHVCSPGEDLGAAMAAAVAAANGSASPAPAGGQQGGGGAVGVGVGANGSGAAGGSRVSTLIVPHDLSWERSPAAASPAEGPHSNGAAAPAAPGPSTGPAALPPGVQRFVRDAAAALKACPRGKAALYVGGRAALAQGDALLNCGRIAAATGAALLCENAFSRLDRGAGLPNLARLPYFPQDAAAALAPFQLLLLLDARRPVANFGYAGAPRQLVTLPDAAVWEFDSWSVDLPAALALLAQEVGGSNVRPGVNCGGAFCPASRPAVPTGRLTAAALCQTVAALQPPGAIIADESLTSGGSYFELSRGCPPFAHLTLTGGAIGAGIPLALGAAVACPDRVVINLQADGSGMYSCQGLWSQAREGLKVITIVCANRANGKAAKALTEIDKPAIDWVQLAQGMGVAACRATTCEELAAALTAALERSGPSLIEAVL